MYLMLIIYYISPQNELRVIYMATYFIHILSNLQFVGIDKT